MVSDIDSLIDKSSKDPLLWDSNLGGQIPCLLVELDQQHVHALHLFVHGLPELPLQSRSTLDLLQVRTEVVEGQVDVVLSLAQSLVHQGGFDLDQVLGDRYQLVYVLVEHVDWGCELDTTMLVVDFKVGYAFELVSSQLLELLKGRVTAVLVDDRELFWGGQDALLLLVVEGTLPQIIIGIVPSQLLGSSFREY